MRVCPTPVTAQKLTDWLTEAVQRGVKVSSMVTNARNLKAWVKLHIGDGAWFPNPGDEAQYKMWVSGAQATLDMSVRRPPPLTYLVLLDIDEALDHADPHQAQVWAHMVLAHDAMLRGGDATGRRVLVRDLSFVGDWAFITLRKRKHNRRGEPELLPLSPLPRQFRRFSAAYVLRRYLRRTGLLARPDAPLFAKLGTDGRVRLPAAARWPAYQSWYTTFCRTLTAAGHPTVTPQATRAGGFTDAVAGGMTAVLAARHGGWTPRGAWPRYMRLSPRETGSALTRAGSGRRRGHAPPRTSVVHLGQHVAGAAAANGSGLSIAPVHDASATAGGHVATPDASSPRLVMGAQVCSPSAGCAHSH